MQAVRKSQARCYSSLIKQMQLNPGMTLHPHRRTKIVATMGPACIPILKEMLQEGVNVARINCAHGDYDQYAGIVASVRKAEEAARKDRAAGVRYTGQGPLLTGSQQDVAAVAFDIKGPEIRVGKFGPEVPPSVIVQTKEDGTVVKREGPKEVQLQRGDRITLTTDPAWKERGTAKVMYISYGNVAKQAQVGQSVMIDDGNMELVIERVNPSEGTLTCVSRTTGPLGERKNVNLPAMEVDLPAVTEKDVRDIATAKALGADFLFASFVQSAAAVREIRALAGKDIRIISKIESQQGIDRFDEILSASDGIMVARGDLGVQIPAERVFLAQKMMIAKANVAGKPIITATQMLDSMITHAHPTRAEVVDVASAVLDGTDAVMLSGETAKGRFPLEAVRMMSRTCQAAEAAFSHRAFFTTLNELPEVPARVETDEALLYHETEEAREWMAGRGHEQQGFSDLVDPYNSDFMGSTDIETLAASAVHASFEAEAAAIIVITTSSRTASLIAKYRPSVPVLALVSDEEVARRLQLCRGVQALRVAPTAPIAELKAEAIAACLHYGLAVQGQRVIVVTGAGASQQEGGLVISLSQVR